MGSLGEIIEQYRLRKAAEAKAQFAHLEMTGQPVAHPKIIPAANTDDVMREQFEEMMEQGSSDSRYLAVRAVLLQTFAEPTVVRAMGVGA